MNEGNYLVEAVPDEALIVVRAKKSNATCKISVTSTLIRPHPFEYYNGKWGMALMKFRFVVDNNMVCSSEEGMKGVCLCMSKKRCYGNKNGLFDE